MGFGSAFKSAWNKASETVQQKVAQVATTAKQVVNQAVVKTQQAAQQAKAVAKFVVAQTAKAAGGAQQAVKKAAAIAAPPIVKAVEKAAQNVNQAAVIAKQNVQQAATAAKHTFNKAKPKLASTAKKIKNTFNKIKKEFSEANRVNKPILACPYGRIGYTNVEDGTKEGKLKLEGEAALYKYKKETQNAAVETSVIYGNAGIDGSRISAEAAAFKLNTTVQVGKDSLNPRSRIDSEIKLASAEAKFDFLPGYDTRRVGLALGGSLGASAASVNVKSERNISIPFTNWSLSVRKSLGKGIGPSVGAGGHAYWDKEEKRFHMGGFGELLKVDLGLDISLGKKYTTRERKADW